jgi:hypothetical protein
VLYAVALPLAGMTALRVLAVAGARPSFAPAVEVALGGAAIVGAALATDGAPLRRALVLVAAAALVAAGLWRTSLTAVLLGHAHNLVALALLLAWWRAPLSRRLALALAYTACAAAIALGAGDGLTRAAGGFAAPSTGLDFAALTATLAPGLGATAALRVVLLFAFAQAVHYAVWLSLLPTALAPAPSLRTDLGTPALTAALLLAALLPLAGIFAPARTREIYLSLVLFHGWLELALIARLMVRAPRASRADSPTV